MIKNKTKWCSHCKREETQVGVSLIKYSVNRYGTQYHICRECNNERRRNYYKNNKEKIKEINIRYELKNKDKRSAWGKRYSSKMPKKPCEVCGKENVDAHHSDYNKPLEVMWLCRGHHKDWHKYNKAIELIHS